MQIDSVDAPDAGVNINGQTVTVTYGTLQVGETQQFSIFTTVLSGASVENTACINADNQTIEECATALPVSQFIVLNVVGVRFTVGAIQQDQAIEIHIKACLWRSVLNKQTYFQFQPGA